MRLRRAVREDAPAVLGLFDEAVRWLTNKGRTEQWGTGPFSTNPKQVARVESWLADEAWLAETGDRAAGFVAFGTPHAYVPPSDVPELYVSGLVGGRFPRARGAGRMLLEHARARAVEEGVERVRLDCYADEDRVLVDFYRSAGFTATDELVVAGKPVQVLELRLR
ncbi:GNAT family N-acetyltransferase [Kutzneria sp. CA-103260]|uniref:GNAT family N-acetyltransferase n=1 Tax=Kutzneria sp. CA-103260 TaxID=2802641 RepID=UPI001BAA5E3E|nr:GNAT family N-acetyltransferase [Kutzneria sp. CA-103260]QUQ68204.1 GNAT family N-acetyltransferase [Kutzneria sp. CA-103260]